MFLYLQLLFIYFYFYLDDSLLKLIIFVLNFYSILFYFTGYSYIKIVRNNKYSFPKLSMKKYPKLGKNDKLYLMYNYFNKEIYNCIKNRYFPVIDIDVYTIKNNSFEGLNCGTLNLYFEEVIPNLKNSYVKNLNIDHNLIKSFKSDNLPKNIRRISAKYCSLEEFEIENHSLVSLDLSNNNLSNVKINCRKLKVLYLNKNKIVNLKIDSPNLKFLDIRNNLLEKIKISNLDVLNISNNQFVVLPSKLLNIPRIYIYDNPIIPNLNNYRWNQYFNIYYPQFFENNIDTNSKNVYQDKELVHNTNISESIKLCIKELEEKYYKYDHIDYKNIFGKKMETIEDIVIINKFTIKQMMATIMKLAKENNVEKELIPIIIDELEDGQNYCISGKIGRLLTSIMGFNLINNVITVSINEEIMAKYDIISKRIQKEIGENNIEFTERLRKEFESELKILGIHQNEIDDWVKEII